GIRHTARRKGMLPSAGSSARLWLLTSRPIRERRLPPECTRNSLAQRPGAAKPQPEGGKEEWPQKGTKGAKRGSDSRGSEAALTLTRDRRMELKGSKTQRSGKEACDDAHRYYCRGMVIRVAVEASL